LPPLLPPPLRDEIVGISPKPVKGGDGLFLWKWCDNSRKSVHPCGNCGERCRDAGIEGRAFNQLHQSWVIDLGAAFKGSRAERDVFMRQHPCPSTGRTSGRCPGYVVDHVRALECGGADAPSNMQWQTMSAAKAKDRTERYCR